MFLGNPNWQQYWLEQTYAKFWGKDSKIGAGAEGIFTDNLSHTLPFGNHWYEEGHPDHHDIPTDYFRDGVFQADLWRKHVNEFLARGVPWLKTRNIKLTLNVGNMGSKDNHWDELDSLPNPPFAAMEEGAFFHPWARRDNSIS